MQSVQQLKKLSLQQFKKHSTNYAVSVQQLIKKTQQTTQSVCSI